MRRLQGTMAYMAYHGALYENHTDRVASDSARQQGHGDKAWGPSLFSVASEKVHE